MPVRIIAAVFLVICINGCSLIPGYQKPETAIEGTWPKGQAYTTVRTGRPAVDIAWKEYFKSDSLRMIIERTLQNNQDLNIALLNIDRTKALYRIQQSKAFPVIDVNSSFSRSGTPENISASGSSTTTILSANVGMTAYELDFFGRVKSLNQGALESYLATEEAFYNTRIALISQIAQTYLGYLADKKLLQLAQDTHQVQEQTYEVVKRQFEIGAATRLDMTRALTSVENAKVSILQYTRLNAQAKNALAQLAGTRVEDLLDNKDTIDTIQLMGHLPEGVPSEILAARPDIRQAEHQLRAANADIGAARAALYPSIRLTGAFGLASERLSSLFDSGAAYAWNFTPSISIPIFNRGRLKATLETAEIDQKIAVSMYEGVIQQAFREVADQLAARGTYETQLNAQMALVKANREAYNLSSARYKGGIDDFLTVLDSQRSLFSAEQKAVTTRLDYLNNLILIYKTLGGGQV